MSAEARPGEPAAIRVAVAGAAGRMGATTCEAVIGAPDMELVARADPALGVTLAQALDQRPGRAGRLHGPHERGAERPAGLGGRRSRRDRNHRL